MENLSKNMMRGERKSKSIRAFGSNRNERNKLKKPTKNCANNSGMSSFKLRLYCIPIKKLSQET